MSFLRSVIADARPRKSTPGYSDSPLATIGWKTHGMGGYASATKEIPLGAVEQTSPLGMSLPIQDRASEFIVGATPTISRTDNPVIQDTQVMESYVEPKSSFSVTVAKSGSILNEESYSHMDIGNLSNRASDSEGDRSYKAEEIATSQPTGAAIQHGRMTSRQSQGKDHSNTFSETHGSQYESSDHADKEPTSSPVSIGETHTKRTVATQTTNLNSSESSGRIESSVREASLAPPFPSPDVTEDSGHGNSAMRNENEIALADVGKVSQVLQGVYKQANLKISPSQKEIPRMNKRDEAKGGLHDDQPVSRQAIARASQGSSDTKYAPFPQSVGKKVSTPVSSQGPASTKPGSLEQHVVSPAKSSASAEALRSVPATLFQTESMPGAGDTFYSSSPLQSREKAIDAPKVQIGQIDVIIEAPAQSVPKPAPAPIDLASRHYLRRL